MLPSRILEILMDASRLSAVKSTQMIDSKPDQAFDDLSAMALLVFKASVAQITFMESERQFFKSSLGFDAVESPTKTSFCAYTIASTEQITVSLDASADKRFHDNPFVINAPNVRFYAGAPIVVDGQNVGTICLYDFEPRIEVTTEQADALLDLAKRAGELVKEKRQA